MIQTESFPGWKDFEGLLSHLRFVKGHHRKITKIAIVTDSKVASVAESLAKHFISAQIKQFAFSDEASARTWLQQGGSFRH